VLIDEAGLFLHPLVRRSRSLVGRTPVVGGDGGHRPKVSVIGAVSVSPISQRLDFSLAPEVGGYFSAEKVVAFLRGVLTPLRGKVVVIWDGGPNHHGPVLRESLRALWERSDLPFPDPPPVKE
jgi:putative transposase